MAFFQRAGCFTMNSRILPSVAGSGCRLSLFRRSSLPHSCSRSCTRVLSFFSGRVDGVNTGRCLTRYYMQRCADSSRYYRHYSFFGSLQRLRKFKLTQGPPCRVIGKQRLGLGQRPLAPQKQRSAKTRKGQSERLSTLAPLCRAAKSKFFRKDHIAIAQTSERTAM